MGRPMTESKHPLYPAQHVIDKCGGVTRTAELAGVHQSWVYRWTYPKDKGGTGGRIPAEAQHNLLAAAHRGQIEISPADFFEVGEAA